MARATLLYSTDQPDSPDILLACVTAASTSLVLGDHCESLGAALKRDDVAHADRPVRVGRGDPLEDLEGEMSQHRQLRFRETGRTSRMSSPIESTIGPAPEGET